MTDYELHRYAVLHRHLRDERPAGRPALSVFELDKRQSYPARRRGRCRRAKGRNAFAAMKKTAIRHSHSEKRKQVNTFAYTLMNQMELPKRRRRRYNEGNLTKE